MASYINSTHEGRIVLVPAVPNIFATVYATVCPPGAVAEPLHGCEPSREIYREDEVGADDHLKNAYNFPFLFHKDGTPWIEANSYLYHIIQDQHPNERPTDQARRIAAELLDYLIFCESQGIDWKDFSGKRPSHRPTYKYFNYLKNQSKRSSRVTNQYTGAVYNFYKYVSRYWHSIDMERVDTVRTFKSFSSTAKGSFLIERVRRSQTLSTAPTVQPDIGTVRDEGEDLRPLTNQQLKMLQDSLTKHKWRVQDRLIVDTALMTGARKQTVLTLRLKHLAQFTEENLRRDNTYAVKCGPGTGIDTKHSKALTIYIPKALASRLSIWAKSPTASKRQKKFMDLAASGPIGSQWKREDVYLFLSEQGNSYYVSKDDPNYPFIKTPAKGQVTTTIKRKILKYSGSTFPKDFTFHWLRATFAFQLYQYLQPLVDSGRLGSSDQISIIQIRLSHSYRETTEHYLKLFKMFNENLAAQEGWEDWLMGGEGMLQNHDNKKLA
ncbi:site-specific integrase [Pseudomonas protegens]|uniref:site-specific integrase n=1 Tax=Pseudomonas protegens TaxID=380021 RepID=UPI000CCF6DBF|nr:site-specific integrase [Pseudomonas protegens]PNV99395.1 integrase [Pseudomonas protegens]